MNMVVTTVMALLTELAGVAVVAAAEDYLVVTRSLVLQVDLYIVVAAIRTMPIAVPEGCDIVVDQILDVLTL